jgi:hypothetical protein
MTTPDVVGKIGGSEGGEPPRADPAPVTATEQRLLRPIPTDRLSFPNQFNVIRAYGLAASEGARVVTGAELGRLTGLNPGSTSLNNSFLADVGLIVKAGQGYMPNADVIAYARAHGFSPGEAAHRLAPTLRKAWFGELLVPRLLMGRPTTETQALSDLAVAVAANDDHRQRLLTIIEYMIMAGLVVREGANLRAGPTARPDGEPRSGEPAQTPSAEVQTMERPVVVPTSGSRVQTAFSAMPMGGIDFTVAVKVDLMEMATWKPEATAAFFEGLAKVISAKAMVERDTAR